MSRATTHSLRLSLTQVLQRELDVLRALEDLADLVLPTRVGRQGSRKISLFLTKDELAAVLQHLPRRTSGKQSLRIVPTRAARRALRSAIRKLVTAARLQ